MEQLCKAMMDGQLCLPWEDLQTLLSAGPDSTDSKERSMLPQGVGSTGDLGPEAWVLHEIQGREHHMEDYESRVTVSLENRELWKQFNSITNEMIITKVGRRMFPLFQVSLDGLQPSYSYALLLEFKLSDPHRWRFLNGEWQSIGGASSLYELPDQRTVFIHPSSPLSGSQWMKEKVTFSKLKVSNKEDGKGKIKLSSLYRYQPCLHIVEVPSLPSPPSPHTDMTSTGSWCGLISTHIFHDTQFIAVTAYQNDKITQMKIKYNPFAKAFLTSQGASTSPYYKPVTSRRPGSSGGTSLSTKERVPPPPTDPHTLSGTSLGDQLPPTYHSYGYLTPSTTWSPPPPQYTTTHELTNDQPNNDCPFSYHCGDQRQHTQTYVVPQLLGNEVPYSQNREGSDGYQVGATYDNHSFPPIA